MSATMVGGKYQLQSPIGKGPHGAVFRALHVQLQRPVVVKVLSAEAVETRALERFRKYALGLGRVRHPGIATFIELVEEEGRICLVSELADGAPLSNLLKNGAHPEPKLAWDIARQLLESLAYAHQHGAPHRNIKPANIFVTPEGRVTLTDFATGMLHKASGDDVEYLSPEHIAEGKLTARSDIYQVGIVVYQLVTGKLPFTGSPEAVAHRIAEERPTDPSSFNRGLAWQLDWVVQKALSKEPEERFNTAVDFGEGLRLGLQDTVGIPLAPITPPAPASAPAKATATASPQASAKPTQAPGAAATPASPILQNARVLAAKTAPAAPPAAKSAAGAAPEPSAAAPTTSTTSTTPAAPTASTTPAGPAAPTAPDAPPAPAANDAAKPSILFVDDDARILNSLRALFRQEYNVHTAEGGETALEILSRHAITVIVSDQRMPGITGVELLRKARAVAPNAVRLLLTGYTDLASLVGSINQGEIFRFVMKPWDNDELRKAIAEAVRVAAQAAVAPPATPTAPRSAGSLLVIDRGEGVAKGLERLLAGSARVIRVDAPADAAKVLSREEIAAVVADMGSGMDGLVALFRELRAKRPGVLSILLTDQPDSELAIELINRAQIFRLLPKPVSARDLRSQVSEALRRYSVFKQRAQAASSRIGDRVGAPPGRSLAGAA